MDPPGRRPVVAGRVRAFARPVLRAVFPAGAGPAAHTRGCAVPSHGGPVAVVTSGCVRGCTRGHWLYVTVARSAPTRPRAVPAAAVVVAILLLGVNLRAPIIAVSPVLDTIAADLHIGEATAGLLTSLPVLCFGVLTPLASALLGRAGLGRGVSISLAVLLV